MPSVESFFVRLVRLFPLSLQMRANDAMSRWAGYAEPEIHQLSLLASRYRTAIDVGANSGTYTYQMSRVFERVWAFEPNRDVVRTIAAAHLRNVKIELVALSSKAGHATLKIPVVDGLAYSGWATLGANPISNISRNVEVRTELLDSYGINDVDFIKIDAEGHELEVLLGALETIKLCRPVCLVEANVDLDGFFKPLGYTKHTIWHGLRLSPQNLLYVPPQLE